MTITRMGISSLMGYANGGDVIDETMQDNLVDETNKKQIENKVLELKNPTSIRKQIED